MQGKIYVPAEFPAIPPSHHRFAIVGEAPGRFEEEQRRPFVGASGKVLDSLLHSVGIIRRQCLVTNVVKYRPPNNDFSSLSQDEIKAGTDELWDELTKFNPTMVIAMGAVALKALTGKTSIEKWRGSIINATRLHKSSLHSYPCVPTYHPAAILREYNLLHIARCDLKKAASPTPPPKRLFETCPSFTQCIEHLRWLSTQPAFGFDIETDSRLNIVCMAFAASPLYAMVIPLENEESCYFSLDEESALWREIANTLSSPAIKVMHNAMFELFVLKTRAGITICDPVFDTMLAAHSCYAELPKSLDFITSIYTSEPYYKDDRQMWDLTKAGYETLWNYNAKDAAVTMECYEELKKELTELNAWSTYNLEVSLLRPLLNASLQGIKYDRREALKRVAGLQAEISSLQRILDACVGEAFNVRSPKQVSKLLYEVCKLPIRTVKGRVTTNIDALYSILTTHHHPIVELIIAMRKRLKEQEMLSILPDHDGRVRCSFNIAGQETGRISSSKTLMGTGTNLQTVPDEHRDLFLADDGCSLVVADLEQAESWVTAYLIKESTRDPILVNTLNMGVKIHKIIAASVVLEWFSTAEIAAHIRKGSFPPDVLAKINSIEKTSAEYFVGKQIGHATNYGLGATRLAELIVKQTDAQIVIPQYKARALMESYHNLFPCIKQWHAFIQATLSSRRQLVNPFGRQRVFLGRMSDDLWRQAYAFIPQSTVPDVISQVITKTAAECQWADIPFGVAHHHDGLMAQVKDSDIPRFLDILSKNFNVPIVIGNSTFVIPTEIKVGKKWRM